MYSVAFSMVYILANDLYPMKSFALIRLPNFIGISTTVTIQRRFCIWISKQI